MPCDCRTRPLSSCKIVFSDGKDQTVPWGTDANEAELEKFARSYFKDKTVVAATIISDEGRILAQWRPDGVTGWWIFLRSHPEVLLVFAIIAGAILFRFLASP